MKKLLLGATVLGALASAAPAYAASINGTSSVGAVTTTSSTAHLQLGDVLQNTFGFIGGSQTGDFVGNVPPGTAITESSLTATAGSAYSWTMADGSFAGAVSGSPILVINNALSRTLSVYVLGTFTPAGTLAAFTPGPLSETISYTETDAPGGAASFSFSGTIASPPAPPPSVPEPATIALLGVGLLGLGLVRRRA